MANWLFTITEENFEVVKSSGVFGVPEGSKAPRLVKPGDKLVFYVMKTGAKSLGGMIVGVFRATFSWRRENRRLWPDEIPLASTSINRTSTLVGYLGHKGFGQT